MTSVWRIDQEDKNGKQEVQLGYCNNLMLSDSDSGHGDNSGSGMKWFGLEMFLR